MKKIMTTGVACLLALAPAALAQKARTASENHPAIFTRSGGSYLGVGVADIDADRARELKLPEVRGVEIKNVDDDSPAAKAGLKEGDVVLEYNGQRIEGMEQLTRMVRETPAGREVKIVFWRNGASQTAAATIGKRSGRAFNFADGQGFVFPMPPAVPAIPDVPHGMMSWRSTMLGIESESLTSQLAEFFGVKKGVLVRSVMKNSAAEKAGIKAGDVIVKVDDTQVTNSREITSVLRAARSKKTVPVALVREKREMTVTVTLDDDGAYRGLMPVRALAARYC